MVEMLNEVGAAKLVEDYMSREEKSSSTQEILDSGAIPQLRGFKVRPGKVSDCIFGGEGSYTDKEKGLVKFENPPLVYENGKPLILMVRTQRISTHDITRGEIPFKDQILALNHNVMRKLVMKYIGSAQLDISGINDNSVVLAAEKLTQIGFENVLRAYMAKSTTETSLYQHYIKGERVFCGHNLPDNLIPNGILPYVMDTPSTKSDEHDESLSPEDMFKRKICTPEQYTQIRNGSLVAFGAVSHRLRTAGVILVDKKTEHGINSRGEIESQDELYTMDSSRFWLVEDYNKQLQKLRQGEITELSPKSYSKEFARDYSKGEEGYTDEQRIKIAVRYILGIQNLLGISFEPDSRPRNERVISGLETIVKELGC